MVRIEMNILLFAGPSIRASTVDLPLITQLRILIQDSKSLTNFTLFLITLNY